MRNRQPPAAQTDGPRPSLDSEITWLLHRAAQRLRGVTSHVAEQYGLTMRDYIVLSALAKAPASPNPTSANLSAWTRSR